MFLALQQRRGSDQLTLSRLFRACCEEMKDLSFMEVLKRILELAVDKLRKSGVYAEEMYQSIISAIFGAAIDLYTLDKPLCHRSR